MQLFHDTMQFSAHAAAFGCGVFKAGTTPLPTHLQHTSSLDFVIICSNNNQPKQ